MSLRPLWGALAVAALIGCGADDGAPGLRGACAVPSGEPLGCEDPPIASAEDACWKLVSCGAIPVDNPEDDPSCCFDLERCLRHVEALPAELEPVTLACVEASSCDQLVWNGSPDRPARNRRRMPPCLQHGDQP